MQPGTSYRRTIDAAIARFHERAACYWCGRPTMADRANLYSKDGRICFVHATCRQAFEASRHARVWRIAVSALQARE